MSILITICARGGSKGIPGKNIRLLNDKPLIAYSIDTARKFAQQVEAKISLSTESEDIKKVAREYGLNTNYTRPDYLATDTAGKVETIEHLLHYEEKVSNTEFEYVLDLDATSPLRNCNDLIAAYNIIQNDKNALNLFSVNKAARNPYFNMVEQTENGYYQLSKKGKFLTRQSAPAVYELNASFYFYRRAFFKQEDKSTIGIRSLIYLMPHICFDLDHPIDFDFMEYLVTHNKLGFDL